MGLFNKDGGIMNIIRCDLQDYLVWKWRPDDAPLNSTTRENAIRLGSSLRVKDGEVAVFVYKQDNGTLMDFIMGPYDGIIKTKNLPILTNIMGIAWGGASPFQADIYFINLAGNVQIKFGVPYFDVVDPRFLDFVVPVAAAGKITFNITDYKAFIKLNRMQNFTLENFKSQVEDAVKRRVKAIVSNAPVDFGFPLVQIERKIDEINDRIYDKLKEDFEEDFGVNLKRLDLSRLEPDKESEGWHLLREVTAKAQRDTILAQNEINIRNLEDTQRINAQNMEESLRIQREETQRAQRLTTETQFIGAHALDRQADVLQSAAENLGQMGSMNLGGGQGGGFNAAGMMAGMAVGGAVGTQMAGMMNNMGAAMNGAYQGMQPGMPGQQMPPVPGAGPTNVPIWMIAVNGNQSGPFSVDQLRQLLAGGSFTPDTYVWRQGMANWELARNVAELAVVFAAPTAPPPPPMPPVPPVPPVSQP